MTNWKELIIKAAEESNWDEVIKLGQDAKLNNCEQTIFGIKKGYLNVFKIPESRYRFNFSELCDFLTEIGYKVYYYSLDEGTTPKIVIDNYVCLFTPDNSYLGKLHKKGYQIHFFEAKTREYDSKKVYYINDDNNKWRFEDVKQLQALIRDAKIDSILKD